MTTHITPEHACPSCRRLLDAASEVGAKAVPQPGDLSICLYCKAWLVFNADMSLRLIEQEDIETLPEDLVNLLKNATVAITTIQG